MNRLIGSFLDALLATVVTLGVASAAASASTSAPPTTTPIKHLVAIFQENVSFDHYFATYPQATNPAGEPRFSALPGTPTVNGLSGNLIAQNPNAANPVNAAGAANPFRLDRSEAATH